MDHKKILIIGPAYPLRGGLATFNERLALAFNNQNHSASIETFSLQYPDFIFPGTTQYATEPYIGNININVSINSINPFNWLKIGFKLKKQQTDIIVVRYWIPLMGPCLGTILRIVKMNKHTQIFCIADNIIPHEKRIGDKIFTKYFLSPIDKIITMSKKVQSDAFLFAPNKPTIFVPHPLYDNFGEEISKNEARDILKINLNKKVILFFGFIRKYKGLDLLYHAIAKLKKDNQLSDIQFLIAGEFYDDESAYTQLEEELLISKFLIKHTHFIADSEVKNYFCAADVVIQPYKNATQSGVTPLAYHFNKPMIVTNVGALPDMVPSNIGLIAEPNAVDIASTIVTILSNDLDNYSKEIKIEKQKYNWDNITKEILN